MQLLRGCLALDDYQRLSKEERILPVGVCWVGNVGAPPLPLPRDSRLQRVSLDDDLERFLSRAAETDGPLLCFGTRLVVARGGFAEIIDQVETDDLPVLLAQLPKPMHSERFPDSLTHQLSSCNTHRRSDSKWFYLRAAADIPAAERHLLSGAAKTQDGVIARYLNRPLSRNVSHWLVRTSVTPNQFTLVLMLAPLAGAFLLARGEYAATVWGAILFQLHSALDGCDGEIARAKYLASEWGHKFDCFSDRLATVLLAIGLGVGLSRGPNLSEGMSYLYLFEGIVTAALIGIFETLLQRTTIEETLARDESAAAYPGFVRNNSQFFNAGDHLKIWAIKHTGMLRLGEHVTSFFVQLTKRDVFNFAFALMMICGWSHLVLHILAFVALGITVVTLKNLAATVYRRLANA